MTTPTSPCRITVATSPAQLASYREMTYPLFAEMLDRAGADPTVLAITAETDEPAGLALVEVGRTKAVVRSVYVVPHLRRRGIGLALLQAVEDELRKRGIEFVGGGFPRNSESAPIEGLLARAGWNPPTRRMYLFRIHVVTALPGVRTAPWFRDTDLAPGTEMVPYSALSPDELAEVDRIMQRYHVPGGLHPVCPEPLDTDLSLALKINGELFGWSVCHRMSQHWVRFTSTYVRPDCPIKGLGVRLTVETMIRYIKREEHNPEAIATWGVPAHLPMAGFQLRRYIPYMTGATITELWESGKDLSPTG